MAVPRLLMIGATVCLASSEAWAGPRDSDAFRGCPANVGTFAEATSHPVNGDVLIELVLGGCNEHPLDRIVARVNEEIVDLVAAAEVRGSHDTIPYAVDPPPEVGDTLTLFLDGRMVRSLDVVAPDETPPTGPKITVLADYEYSFLLGDGESDVWSFLVDVDVVEVAMDASAVRYDIELTSDGEIVDALAVLENDWEFGDSRTAYPASDDNPFHGAEEICAHVAAIDAAGHASDRVTTCIPGLAPEPLPPDEDEDEDEDDGAGLPTAEDGGGDGAGHPADDRSGAGSCRVGDGQGGFLFGLLPLWAMRRRRGARRQVGRGPSSAVRGQPG